METKRFDKFKSMYKGMISTNQQDYNNRWFNGNDNYKYKITQYSKKEILEIIATGSIEQYKYLSERFFYGNSFYMRLLSYYATVNNYDYLIIPHSNSNTEPKKNFVDNYYKVLNFTDKMNIKNFAQNCMLQALIYGAYYGVITKKTENEFLYIDLPPIYCNTLFKNDKGQPLIQFDLTFFDSIYNEDDRESALRMFPPIVSKAYKDFKKGKIQTNFITFSEDISICFNFPNNIPPFLSVIPSIIDFEEVNDLEIKKIKRGIKKIVTQTVGHTNDGTLIFEPEEAEEMHKGAVRLLADDEDVSVLTSFLDTNVLNTDTNTNTENNNNFNNFINNIYFKSGVSKQMFSADSNLTLIYSVKNDIKFMSFLINQLEIFIYNTINSLFGNEKKYFKFKILDNSIYNQEDKVENAIKMASTGYSLLVPAITMGIKQSDIEDLKILENDILKFNDKLIPFTSAYNTNSNKSNNTGAPKKKETEKSDKTIVNEDSLDGGI